VEKKSFFFTQRNAGLPVSPKVWTFTLLLICLDFRSLLQ
jgi:hypothetical protein